MLIIQPIGGLCNRMRSINSAYKLAAMRGERLTVIWFCNQELGCSFDSIFQLNPTIHLINITSKFDIRKMFYQFTSQVIGNEEIRANKIDRTLNDNFRSSLKKRCYIATEEHFYPADSYELFQPLPELQQRIGAIISGFSAHTVGIHIRRTDNLPSIHKSATENFVSAMREELHKNPDTLFYLATDDAMEEAHLRNFFPDRILANTNKDLSRDSLRGMQDALIDLYCLAATDKIIGSFYSSFTDIAADMHHIPKMIAGATGAADGS